MTTAVSSLCRMMAREGVEERARSIVQFIDRDRSRDTATAVATLCHSRTMAKARSGRHVRRAGEQLREQTARQMVLAHLRLAQQWGSTSNGGLHSKQVHADGGTDEWMDGWMHHGSDNHAWMKRTSCKPS